MQFIHNITVYMSLAGLRGGDLISCAVKTVAAHISPDRKMRSIPFFTLCVILLVSSSAASASGDDITRIGLTFGGMHIVGIYVEREVGEAAVRAQVGYMIHAISMNVSAVRYFGSSHNRPYAGLGFMKHLRQWSFQGDNLLCIPVGIDFDFADRQYVGLEIIPAVPCSIVTKKQNIRKNLVEYIFPLPSMSYKYRL